MINIVEKIDNESQENISSRYFNFKNKSMPKFSKVDALLTVEDHKKDFPLNIECITINPSENSLGKIRKNILENIVSGIKKKASIIQWKNIYEVIRWFDQIENKPNMYFVNFDIEKFYPSIKSNHLKSVIEFARRFTSISDEEVNIIDHTCNSILTYNGSTWTKKDQDSTFDVPMGSYFGAELCDLVGLHILDKLQKSYMPNQIGLYRDDGLATIRYTKNQNLENMKKPNNQDI